MRGHIIALLSSGALAIAVSSGSVLAAGDDKEQSKLRPSAAVLVVPGAQADKDLTVTSATAATVAIPVAPALKKKNDK
jgi:hypothetical protein